MKLAGHRHYLDLDFWADNIATRFVSSHIIDKKNKDVYVYGLDLLIYSCLSIGTILFFGVATNLFLPTVAFLSAALPLQALGGGFHASTHLRCYAVMLCTWGAAMWLYCLAHGLSLLALATIGLYAIWRLAPIEHKNAQMSREKTCKMRRFARRYSLCAYILSVAFALFDSPMFSATSVGLVASGASMFMATYLRGRHEITVNAQNSPQGREQ